LWLDGALSSARPPAGAPQSTTTSYGILGARGEIQRQPWKLSATASGGHTLENAGGRWIWLQSEVQHSLGKAGVFWLDYRETFDYSTVGVQLEPEWRFAKDAFALRPHATLAHWSTDLESKTYSVLGGTLQWTRNLRSLLLRATGEAYASGNNGYAAGGYFSLSADVYTVVRQTTLGAGLTQAHNPNGGETGYMLWASRAFGERLRVEAQLARTVTDAVFGAPGSLGFTLSSSWRIHHHTPPPPPLLASVGEAVSKGRVVAFNLKVEHARTVAVSGTFSDWRPIALKRTGDVWSGSVTIEPGTHQYGFLIDGRVWYVPPDAVDVIDDGFGRKNVTLVVRPR
jgi:hypothetical protein